MSSVRRRRLAASSLAVAAVLGLSACGTSFSAQTNQVYQPAAGANARGPVDSLGTLLVANADGSATLSAALHNNQTKDETLTSVTVATQDGQQLQVRSPKIALPVPSDVLTTLGTVDSGAVFTVAEGAVAGGYVEITYTFSDSGTLTVDAPVVARNASYAGISGPVAEEEAVETETTTTTETETTEETTEESATAEEPAAE